jgi:hypothetical protein
VLPLPTRLCVRRLAFAIAEIVLLRRVAVGKVAGRAFQHKCGRQHWLHKEVRYATVSISKLFSVAAFSLTMQNDMNEGAGPKSTSHGF